MAGQRWGVVQAALAAGLALGVAPTVVQGQASSTEGTVVTYVAPGASYHYVPVAVPRPSEQMGAIAVRALQGLSGRDAGPLERLSVKGPASQALPPAGWELAMPSAVAGMRRGVAPFGARHGRASSCDGCATVVGNTAEERIAAVYAVREFSVGAELATLRVLRLRARFRDGLVVRVNGREVARRFVALGAGAVDYAERAHGSDWETFYIPVTSGLLRPGSNSLAVEVRPSSVRLAPAFDLELTGASESTVVRGPMVQRVAHDSAMVVFDTELPTAAQVEYGATPELGSAASSAAGSLALHHEVRLTGLSAGQAVHYRVVVGGHAGPRYLFHTPPAAGEVLRIGVYGDVRSGHGHHREVIEGLLREAPDFVLVTGDLVSRGSNESDWQRFFAVAAELMARVPYYPVAGNHDMGRSGDERRRLNEVFLLWPAPQDRPTWAHWYSFDIGDVHIVMLDSNSYEHEEQLQWLRADLHSARQRNTRAIFALTHAGPWSRAVHMGNSFAAEHYAPVLAEYGVDMLFSGHDHIYQRGEMRGLRYIVTGGGGAPLYGLRCGVSGRPACRHRDGMLAVAKEYHYVLLTVYPRYFTVCARRPDGSPLEECVRHRFRRPALAR